MANVRVRHAALALGSVPINGRDVGYQNVCNLDLGQDGLGQIPISHGLGQLGIDAQSLLVGVDRFVEPKLGLEDVPAQIVIGGVVRNLLDGVIDAGRVHGFACGPDGLKLLTIAREPYATELVDD